MVQTPTMWGSYDHGKLVNSGPGKMRPIIEYPGMNIHVWSVEEQDLPDLFADLVKGAEPDSILK